MWATTTQGMIVFISGSALLILIMTLFLASIIYRYQQRQNAYFKALEVIKANYKNSLLQSQVEIQEQTFQNISREIHDNIGQKLTLVKLLLNSSNLGGQNTTHLNVDDLVNTISEVINDLSAISRSMGSAILLSNGLIKALEQEIIQLKKLKTFDVDFLISGDTLFLDSGKELIIFRIVQEAMNNILKHADATQIRIHLNYTRETLILEITDNGIGFNLRQNATGNGLHNMQQRTAVLNGRFDIQSIRRKGTTITIEIPYKNNEHEATLQSITSR